MQTSSSQTESVTDSDTDYYGYRLAEVNESNPVTAAEAIYNDQGVLLLSQGAQFSRERAALIAKHKLIKPLEHCVDISNSLDGQALFDLLEKFASSLPGLLAVANNEEVRATLLKQCKYYEHFHLLRQKLTVLASQLPEVYYNSLYSAVAGVVLGHALDLDNNDLRCIFIGGLMHNTGFLHLNPELTRNEADLERDESIQVQVHPIIAKHFLDHVPNLPKEIGKAVADHHERTDGTGYPKHKFGDTLTMASQVIAFTDELVSAYKRCEKHDIHAHQLIMTILQFNTGVHFETVYKAAMQLIKLGPQPDTPPEHPPSARDLIVQQERIKKVFEATKKLGFILMKNTKCRLTKSIASMLGRLSTSIISAGITQDEYRDWLDDIRTTDDPTEHLALLKSQVMQDEIEEQIERFKSIMWKTIKQIPENEALLLENCIKSYNQIDKLKVRPAASNSPPIANN